MKPLFSIILPVFNEAENIQPLIEQIVETVTGGPYEIIVVDDNSPDGTARIVADIAQHIPALRCIVRMHDRGLIPSIREGIETAAADIVVWMDADCSMSPRLIPRMVAMVQAGTDLVLGSRYIKGGGIKGVDPCAEKTSIFSIWNNLHTSEDSFFSVMVSMFGNLLLRWILRGTLHDFSSGYFCGRKKVIQEIGLAGIFVDYCISLPYNAVMHGYQVAEIPMILVPRRHGQSKTSFTVSGVIIIAWQCLLKAVILRLSVKDERKKHNR